MSGREQGNQPFIGLSFVGKPNVLPASIIQASDSDVLHLIHMQQIDIYWHNGNGNFQEKL
jgi:hypothetical protein